MHNKNRNSMNTGIKKSSRVMPYLQQGWTSLFFLLMITLPAANVFAQPANDEPCNAISLTVGLSCVSSSFTNANATASAGVPAPGCANYLGADVWFQVVVPAGGAITIETQAGVITDGGLAIYSGTCSALALLACDDDGGVGTMSKIDANGLTPGSTVWIRVWEYGNNSNGSFGICVTLPPPPPANDDPCNAISLTATSACTYTTYSNESATATAGAPAPGCASYNGGDIWFQTVVPCGGSLRIDTQAGSMTDGGMAIYSGTCNGLTLIECDDDDSQNGAMPMISSYGLVPGTTIWIRIWGYGGNNNGSFGLCVQIPPPPPPAASCQTAQPFCTSTIPFTVPNIFGGPSPTGGGIYGCLGSIPNPTFYYLQIQNSGSISITISQATTGGAPIDVDFIVWGPFSSLGATCTGISSSNIVDCSFSPAPVEVADIPNAIAGQFYMFLVTNYNGAQGNITYQQTGGTGSSNCNLVCTLNAANTGPVCSGGLFNLTASNVSNATYSWTGPDCFTSTQQNPAGVIAPITPGQYVYTVTASGPDGIACTDTTILTVSPKPALGTDKNLVTCSGVTVNLTTQFVTTGLTTAWTLNNQPVPNPSAVSAAGTYQLIATNTTGCTDTALVNLTVNQVNASIATVDANCSTNGEITISNPTGTAPFSYNINTYPGIFQSSNMFSVPAGSYTIIIRDANNCTNTQTVQVGFTDNLVLAARPDTTLCRGQSVILNTSSNATAYSWTPATGLNDPSIANPVASPELTSTYTVTATLGSCSKTDAVLVTVDESLTVNAGPDILVISGEEAPIVATAVGSNINNILWTPSTGLSSTNSLATIVKPASGSGSTTYTITVENALGCTASDDVLVTVIPYCIKVKNAFSPNGDGINELWQVYDDYGCLRNVTVHVFNRYGNRVFESRDYRNSWNGTYSNKPVPDGTYYAVAEFTLINGKKLTIKSDLTIIR